MKIFVLNAGSSSLKFQLFDMEIESVLARGMVDRVGLDEAVLQYWSHKKVKIEKAVTANDHEEALGQILAMLTDGAHGVLKEIGEIEAVGHRVAHGGEKISSSVLIDERIISHIRENIVLAPLHNPAMLRGIESCRKLLPGVPMAAVFDTAFHQTLPPEAFLYAIPYDYYTKHKIRRYGFHGTSHRYVAQQAARLAGQPLDSLRIVSCHLGNGSSIAAIKGGRSIDTSMGFTPVAGVPMGTRSGDIDPAIVGYVADKEGLSIKEVDALLNKKSGLYGLSGVSSDLREVKVAARQGNERSQLAIAVMCYTIKKYIGAYAAALGGLDILVFTAGIGENDPVTRANVCRGLEFLGIALDEEINNRTTSLSDPRAVEISAAGSRARVFAIHTDEELMIARETHELLKAE